MPTEARLNTYLHYTHGRAPDPNLAAFCWNVNFIVCGSVNGTVSAAPDTLSLGRQLILCIQHHNLWTGARANKA